MISILHPFAAFRRHLPRSRVARLRDELAELRAGLDALDRGVIETGVEAARANSRADWLFTQMRAASEAAGVRLPEPAPLDEAPALSRAGIAPGHPESLTAEMDEADEEMLAALDADLWGDGEHGAVTADGDDAR